MENFAVLKKSQTCYLSTLCIYMQGHKMQSDYEISANVKAEPKTMKRLFDKFYTQVSFLPVTLTYLFILLFKLTLHLLSLLCKDQGNI